MNSLSEATVVVIGRVYPEPVSSAAGTRMMQILRFFKEVCEQVFFMSSAEETEHSVRLIEEGVESIPTELNSSLFDQQITDLNPDIVLFDRFMTEEQFGWRVREQCPQALRIIDTEDLHGLRKTRETAVKQGREWHSDLLKSSEVVHRELAAIYRSDLSLMISSYEINLLTNVLGVPDQKLYYLPYLEEPVQPTDLSELPDFGSRKNIMTIGNVRHAPNADAIRSLKATIWPASRARYKHLELHIYGSYITDAVQQMHKPNEGFYVRGRAANARSTLKTYKLLVAPLRFGAGLKGKIVDAMATGTPVLTTSIGAEGLFTQQDSLQPGIIEDNFEQWPARINELLSDPEQWIQYSEQGVQLFNSLFNKEREEDRFNEKLEMIIASKTDIRNNDVMGQMMWHQSLNASKYMSRWIEEKNRK